MALHDNMEQDIRDIFADEFNGNMQDEDFFEFGREVEPETYKATIINDLDEGAGPVNLPIDEVASSLEQSNKQRSIRFADDVDPNGMIYGTELENSRATLDEFLEDDFENALGSRFADGGADDDAEKDDKKMADEDDDENDVRNHLLYSVGALAFSVVSGLVVRLIFRCLARAAQQDLSAATNDAATDAADTAAQAKTSMGVTGQSTAGMKDSANAAMQSSFHAASNAAHESAQAAGGFLMNNPSTSMSSAQYVQSCL